MSLELQRTTADGFSLANGSLDVGGTISLQAVVGTETDNQFSQFYLILKIVSLQMSWLQVKFKELGNKKNRQIDPGG